jgi:hypothetical protein
MGGLLFHRRLSRAKPAPHVPPPPIGDVLPSGYRAVSVRRTRLSGGVVLDVVTSVGSAIGGLNQPSRRPPGARLGPVREALDDRLRRQKTGSHQMSGNDGDDEQRATGRAARRLTGRRADAADHRSEGRREVRPDQVLSCCASTAVSSQRRPRGCSPRSRARSRRSCARGGRVSQSGVPTTGRQIGTNAARRGLSGSSLLSIWVGRCVP